MDISHCQSISNLQQTLVEIKQMIESHKNANTSIVKGEPKKASMESLMK